MHVTFIEYAEFAIKSNFTIKFGLFNAAINQETAALLSFSVKLSLDEY